MKIGIDAGCFLEPKSGVAEYTINLLRAMAELRDMEYILFCNSLRRSPNGLPDLGQAKVQLHSIRLPAKLLSALWGTASLPPIEWLMGQFDLFHSPNYRVPFVKNRKLVVTVHDLVVVRFPQFHFAARNFEISMSFRSLHRADCVISVSENTKRDLIEFLGFPEEKIEVIHNGYNPMFHPDISEDIITPVLGKHGLRRPFILNLGTLEPRKNQSRLIEAFNLLCRDEAKEHSLVIVGQKGWLYDDIFAQVEKLRLEDRVIFTGHVPDEDLPPLVKAAEMLVFPSLYEGFGLPPLEAMACGTPVVTSRVSSMPEIVGDAAILVDPHDLTSIAAGMKLVLEDRDMKESLVSKGLERAKLFNWQTAASQTLEVYNKVLNN